MSKPLFPIGHLGKEDKDKKLEDKVNSTETEKPSGRYKLIRHIEEEPKKKYLEILSEYILKINDARQRREYTEKKVYLTSAIDFALSIGLVNEAIDLLSENNRGEQAGDIYREYGLLERAMALYISSGQLEKATKAAKEYEEVEKTK